MHIRLRRHPYFPTLSYPPPFAGLSHIVKNQPRVMTEFVLANNMRVECSGGGVLALLFLAYLLPQHFILYSRIPFKPLPCFQVLQRPRMDCQSMDEVRSRRLYDE